MTRAGTDDSLDRLQRLLDQERLTVTPDRPHGYLNVLAALPPAATPASRLMRTWYYPLVYQLIRPVGLRLASGFAAPGRDRDREAVRAWLGLKPGDIVLDVACGPGNFTGYFGSVVGTSGLAIGLDASDSMLGQAVRDNPGPSVAYLRADAASTPLPTASMDAAACFAALYLVNDPEQVVAEIARVVKPGGRIAILTTFEGQRLATRGLTRVSGAISGMRFFGAGEIASWLCAAGMRDVRTEIAGFAQTVTATR